MKQNMHRISCYLDTKENDGGAAASDELVVFSFFLHVKKQYKGRVEEIQIMIHDKPSRVLYMQITRQIMTFKPTSFRSSRSSQWLKPRRSGPANPMKVKEREKLIDSN